MRSVIFHPTKKKRLLTFHYIQSSSTGVTLSASQNLWNRLVQYSDSQELPSRVSRREGGVVPGPPTHPQCGFTVRTAGQCPRPSSRTSWGLKRLGENAPGPSCAGLPGRSRARREQCYTWGAGLAACRGRTLVTTRA